MEDTHKKILRNSIKYLHNITTLPQMNIPTVKSYLSLKRRVMELRQHSLLSTADTQPEVHCKRCFLSYYNAPISCKIEPMRKKSKFAKKLLKKDPDTLTTYQNKYLKRIKKFDCNKLITKCGHCNFDNTQVMPKREKLTVQIQITPKSTTKRKKKKKDKFCGLNQSAVMSISSIPSKEYNNNDNTKKQNDLAPLKNVTMTQHKENKKRRKKSKRYFNVKLENNTPNPRRDLHDSEEVITIDSDETETPVKFKKSNKLKPLETSTPKVPLKTSEVKKNARNQKKLNQILETSTPKVPLKALEIKKKAKSQKKLSQILENSKKKDKSSLMTFLESI